MRETSISDAWNFETLKQHVSAMKQASLMRETLKHTLVQWNKRRSRVKLWNFETHVSVMKPATQSYTLAIPLLYPYDNFELWILN